MLNDNTSVSTEVNQKAYSAGEYMQRNKVVPFRPKPKSRGSLVKKAETSSLDVLFYEDYADQWKAQVFDTKSGVIITKWNDLFHEHIGGEDGLGYAADWLYRNYRKKATNNQAKSCFGMASKLLRINNPLPVVDPKRTIIPCKDAYLEIMDGKIINIGINPDLGITYALDIKTDTEVGEEFKPVAFAADSKFKEFLNFAQPDPEVQALLQEQCGMCLLPQSYQVAIWWHGEGGSGKSTLASICGAMQKMIGTANLFSLKEKFDLEDIVGVSLVRVEEVPKGRWHEETWKAIISGDPVTVTRKNEKALTGYRFKAKWIITSNTKPFVTDKTNGVWRRICAVEFKKSLPDKQRILNFHELVLQEEGKAILSWMLEGAKRIVQRGNFLPESEWPKVIQEKKAELKKSCDSVREWSVENNCRLLSSYSDFDLTDKAEVYENYLAWAKDIQIEAVNLQTFWNNIREVFPELIQKRVRIKNEHGKYVFPYFVNLAVEEDFFVQHLNEEDQVPFGEKKPR